MARVLIERDSRRPWAVCKALWAGDLGPGQPGDLAVGGGLVGLDHRDVVRVLGLDQPRQVVFDGVQGIEGDHGPGRIQLAQQWAEVAGLVGLGAHLSLGDGGRRVVGQGRELVAPGTVQAGRAFQCLAVDGDRAAPGRGGGVVLAGDASVAPVQVGADGRVEGAVRTVAMTRNREWSSIPVTSLHERPSASGTPPAMSSCHRCIGSWRCQRLYVRLCRWTWGDQPVADQRAVHRRPRRRRLGRAPGELVADAPGSPAGMPATKLAD